MPGTSKTTSTITIRLPNDVVTIIRGRVQRYGVKSISEYLRDRIIYDITRKHNKKRKK